MNNIEKYHRKQLLAESFLFKGLSTGDLDRIVEFTRRMHVAAKKVIIHKGGTGPEMFAIASGCVALTTSSEEGKELLLGILTQGDFFGEISLLDGGQRTATVTALEPCELLVLERKYMLAFIKDNPEIALKMLATMAARIRKTDRNFEDAVFRQLPERLARHLMSLAGTFGEETTDGVKIKVKLSQQQIGKMASASRETVNKQLRAWESEGLIGFDSGYITISNIKQLQHLSVISAS